MHFTPPVIDRQEGFPEPIREEIGPLPPGGRGLKSKLAQTEAGAVNPKAQILTEQFSHYFYYICFNIHIEFLSYYFLFNVQCYAPILQKHIPCL